jgi:hypothetical protein
MVTVIAFLFIAIGALFATVCATADGALLSLDPEDRLPPAIAELRSRRERIHRALAFARVLGQLGAGMGVAVAVRFPARLVDRADRVVTAFLPSGSRSVARRSGEHAGQLVTSLSVSLMVVAVGASHRS